MVNMFGVEVPVPDVSISPLTIALFISVFICIVVFIGVGSFFWFYYLYDRKIELYENLSGRGYQLIFRDRAKVIRIGDGGEELLWLMKKKRFVSAYGRKMAKNLYWFAIGQDGYWYNTIMGDLDSKMAVLDIEPIDRDMRMESVAQRKNVEGRYRKDKWLDKYGIMLMNLVALVLFLTGMYFLTAKQGETASTINEGIKASVEVQESTKAIISSLDNICTGGSGIVPVPIS